MDANLKLKSINYKNEINNLYKDYHKTLAKFADEYRKTILIPFCKKNKLNYMNHYMTGNGSFMFYDCDEKSYSAYYDDMLDDKNQELLDEFKKIFEVLNIIISYDVYFGFYIDNIKYDKL